jgi:hypothetical protein
MGRVYHENPPARFQQGGYGVGQGMQGFAGRGMGMGMGGRCVIVLRPLSPALSALSAAAKLLHILRIHRSQCVTTAGWAGVV